MLKIQTLSNQTILRVHINIKEQKLPTFKRHGYTAIEWGGTIY